MFLQKDRSPKGAIGDFEKKKNGRRTLIYHSGVKTVICRVVIWSEYGADIKRGFSKGLEATVIFLTHSAAKKL